MFKWPVDSTPVTALSFFKNSCLRSLYKLHFKRKCNSSSVSLALQNLHKRLSRGITGLQYLPVSMYKE